MTAIVTGAEGQDGTLLTELLTARGETVVGIGRRGPIDITSAGQVAALVADVRPSRVYLLAAVQHSSQAAPADPVRLAHESHLVNTLQVHHFADAILADGGATRLIYACSSHVFGAVPAAPETITTYDEDAPLRPQSIYGVTKAAGLLACRAYRARGVFASAAILFNHESPLRPVEFVTRKVARAVAAIQRGDADELVVGDLEAGADWGYAPDYVRAMALVLDLDAPEDFVVATGTHHTVAQLCAYAFAAAGLDWRRHVREEPALLTRRRGPVVGDARRLRERTGWAPSVDFPGMVRALLRAEGAELIDHPGAPTARARPVRTGGTEGFA